MRTLLALWVGAGRDDRPLEEPMRSRYLDLEDRNQDLLDLLRESPGVAEDLSRKFELSWIFHENALEGLIFTGQEIETALAQGPLAEATTLSGLRDVRNLKAAIEIVRAEAAAKKPRLTVALARKLHETLYLGQEGRNGSEFRKDIPLHRAYFHEIAPPAKIPALLDKLVALTETAEFRGWHPVQKASRLQHGFMQVYPYTDGSGKVARLLANILLLHAGYLPCIIHSIDRQRYYESLKQPETVLRELMIEALANGLENAEKLVRQARAVRARRA